MTHEHRNADAFEENPRDLPVNHQDQEKGGAGLISSPSHNGFDIWKDIRDALGEKDILRIRQKLKEAATPFLRETIQPDNPFSLAEIIDIGKFVEAGTSTLSAEDLPPEPLPKIHTHHHRRASRETIHRCFEECENIVTSTVVDDGESESGFAWNEVEEAILERDIMEFRDKLKQITESSAINLSFVDAPDRYLEGEMKPAEMGDFEKAMSEDPRLADELSLHRDIRNSQAETDVMALREVLGRISTRYNSTSRSIQEIDKFLNGELEGVSLEEFTEEWMDNKGLKAEVRMVQEIDDALRETAIFRLREKLKSLSREIVNNEKRSFVPVERSASNPRKAGMVAAVLVFALGLSFVFRFIGSGDRDLYHRFYAPPSVMTTFRSTGSLPETNLREGLKYFQQAEYSKALGCFLKIEETGNGNPSATFYAGASYQGLEEYHKAVEQYEHLLNSRENLFMEQARWYKTLCFVALGDHTLALAELEAIISEEGYYSSQAKDLEKKLKRRS